MSCLDVLTVRSEKQGAFFHLEMSHQNYCLRQGILTPQRLEIRDKGWKEAKSLLIALLLRDSVNGSISFHSATVRSHEERKV